VRRLLKARRAARQGHHITLPRLPQSREKKTMSITWEQQQKGWLTSEIGGIVREKDGWHFWPLAHDADSIGPFKTAEEAKRQAEGEN
jgi:hypothetical protein